MWRPEYRFKKAGVMLFELVPNTLIQTDLFSDQNSLENRAKSEKLMRTIDNINNRYRNILLFGTEKNQENHTHWKMNQDYLSPAYTTNWSQILRVR